jgi:nucleoid-associated protein YgaU
MGLFDFVKNVGHKVFNKDEEAGDKIRAHIEQSNPGVQGLQVTYDDGVVALSGAATDGAAMEKAVLMAGNIMGVSEVKADALQAPPAAEQVDYYIIQKGDSLSAIAQRLYGKASAYPRLFEANREVIRDPDLIFPGQKIRVPRD